MSYFTLEQWDRIRKARLQINETDVFFEEWEKSLERDRVENEKREKARAIAMQNETSSDDGSGTPIKAKRELKKAGFELAKEIKEKEKKKEARKAKKTINKMKKEGKLAPIYHYFQMKEIDEDDESSSLSS